MLAAVAHLYLNPDSDSLYLEVTAGDRPAIDMAEAADGVLLHVEEGGAVVAIEVMDLSRRAGLRAEGADMGHLHVNQATNSLYLDVSAGERTAADREEVADGVFLHVDQAGVLAGIEMIDISQRGGLRVSDLDAEPGTPRPALFEEIERVANQAGGCAPREVRSRG
jgi:uncharacterized protein YuzE